MISRVIWRKPVGQVLRFNTTGLRGFPTKCFHMSSRFLTDSKKSKEDRLNDEVRKLKKLREEYRKANFFEKVRLQSELLKQEIKVTEAQTIKFNADIKTPSIRFDENPLDLSNVKRYEDAYGFLLENFLRECEEYRVSPIVKLHPDVLISNIIHEFGQKFPDHKPLRKEEVLTIFHIYYAILNNVIFMDELVFENPAVQSMLRSYVLRDPADDSSEYIKKVAEDNDLDQSVVAAWYRVFDILSSVPFAQVDQKYICSLCPNEYARFNSFNQEMDAFHKNFSKFQNPPPKDAKKENDLGSIFDSLRSNRNHDDGKSNAGKKTKDDKKNKKYVELEFNLNSPPMRYLQLGLLSVLLMYFVYSLSQENDNEITFQELTQFIQKNYVLRLVVVNNKTVVLELNDNGKAQYNEQARFHFNIGSVESFERSLRHVQDEFNIPESLRIPVIYMNEGNVTKMVINFLPTLLFLAAIYYMTKKASMGGMGGPLSFGKSTAKKFNQETDVKIRFKDVAGMAEAKEEVMEFVKFLQHPEKYEKLGAKIPRGAILSGPPGTGKTLLAKATAGEAAVPFFSVSGSEFVEMFVGVGASRVRDLFKTARENAPSIVFVDEIDAIGKQRSKGNASGANDERETTLNQLLVEMDGFESSDHVVVLAGTNRVDILDRALMRPGRFDRHIAIDNPELQGRKEIFEVHLKKVKLADDIDKDLSGRLAALTPGFSGADIANVCNEAALIGARYNAAAVTLRHFELAIERVIGGVEKKSKVLNEEEKRIVAYHEAGHAVCGWFLRYAHPLLKVSIIPRGQGALGYAQYLPPDQYLMSEDQLLDRMVMTLGGRVSEELHFDSVTSGAHDDFKKVTSIAQSMVMRFGMSKKVGFVNYADTRSSDDLTKPFSDETNKIIDDEIERIVKSCHKRCHELLKEKEKEVELVAQELLKKEFITREDMIRLLGKRPFPENNDAFDKYLSGKDAFKDQKPSEEQKDEEGS